MSSLSTSIFKALSMADSSLLSLPSIFSAMSPSLSIPARPVKLQISCAFSTSISPSLSLKKNTQFPSFVAHALELEEGAETQVSDSLTEPSEEDAKIFVANFPYDVDSERLAMLFEQAGVVEIAEVIYNRETDRSRGFGFVTMSTVEEAQKAVEKFNRYELDGRLLVATKASKRGERIERPPRMFAPGFRIYVGSLPWDLDNSRLEQIFSAHGTVSDARVVFDRETGRSRGFGFVTMSNLNEMNNAIAALDGQSVDGRTIRASVAEERARHF